MTKAGPARWTATLAAVIALAAAPSALAEQMRYLDNGVIRVGIDLDLGGAITWLSKSGDSLNLVNNWDWGRQIQMSFYSGPVPYTPGGKQPAPQWRPLGWNPIQAGDHFHHGSRTLECRDDGKSLFVRARPMQWPLDNEPADCLFESRLSLERNTVQATCTLLNQRADAEQYPARNQELPALYTNGPFWRLMTYAGDKPFTRQPLTQMPAVFPWRTWQATENWAALVNDDNWGVGVWEPGVYAFGGGFNTNTHAGGPKDDPTGYIGPLHVEILDHNITYAYSYTIILGSLDEIRRYVYDHADRPRPPNYVFQRDRQHWYYVNAHDDGWPIDRCLKIHAARNAMLVGPPALWQAADARTLVLRAAFTNTLPRINIRWRRFGQATCPPEQVLSLPINPDGAMREYRVDLSHEPTYQGAIAQLRLDPQVQTAGEVQIESIGFAPQP